MRYIQFCSEVGSVEWRWGVDAAAAPFAASSAGLLPSESPAKTLSWLVVWPRCPNPTAWLGTAELVAGLPAAAASGAPAADVSAAKARKSINMQTCFSIA